MIVISGVMPGVQGVGRLLSHLVKESTSLPAERIRFIFGSAGTAGRQALRSRQVLRFIIAIWKILHGKIRLWGALYNSAIYGTDEPVLLIHLQTLGYSWCRRFMEKRTGPTWLYLMDCGYFCVRSYNHIPGEQGACLRCLGGQWQHAKEHNCPPIPFTNFRALKLSKELEKWVEQRKINILVQNRHQAQLVQRHFGGNVEVKAVGLWTADMPKLETILSNTKPRNGRYDVVYHGTSLAAKGFIWAVELAKLCPDLKFLFPCFKADSKISDGYSASNAHFSYVTWETGLAEAVQSAGIVLVPSLWSAPIEGALLKSISFGRLVAVANEPTGFAAELPQGLVLRLPLNAKEAAGILTEAANSGQKPPEQLRRKWLTEFREKNSDLMNRLLSVCMSN